MKASFSLRSLFNFSNTNVNAKPLVEDGSCVTGGNIFNFKAKHMRVVLYQETNHSTVLLYDSGRVETTSSHPPPAKSATTTAPRSVKQKRLPPNLCEMMFGTVPMSFEGTTTKFHLLDNPKRLLVTKLTNIRRIEGVVPLGSSPKGRTATLSDISSPGTTPSGKKGRRISFGPSYPESTTLRKTTFALGVIFKLTDKLPFMPALLFAYYPALEYHINKVMDDLKHLIIGGMYLIEDEETGYTSRSMTYSREAAVRVRRLPTLGELELQKDARVNEVITRFKGSFISFFQAARLKQRPLWMDILLEKDRDKKQRSYQTFLESLKTFQAGYDDQRTNYFLSTVITAVLSNHVSWMFSIGKMRGGRGGKLAKGNLVGPTKRNNLNKQLKGIFGTNGKLAKSNSILLLGSDGKVMRDLLYLLTYFARAMGGFDSHGPHSEESSDGIPFLENEEVEEDEGEAEEEEEEHRTEGQDIHQKDSNSIGDEHKKSTQNQSGVDNNTNSQPRESSHHIQQQPEKQHEHEQQQHERSNHSHLSQSTTSLPVTPPPPHISRSVSSVSAGLLKQVHLEMVPMSAPFGALAEINILPHHSNNKNVNSSHSTHGASTNGSTETTTTTTTTTTTQVAYKPYGESVFASYLPRYTEGFVMMAIPADGFFPPLVEELRMRTYQPVARFSSPAVKASAVVVDTTKWSCEVISCNPSNPSTDYASWEGKPFKNIFRDKVMYSELVRSILYSVVELWGLGVDNEMCIAFLEDRLRELKSKGKLVAKLIRHYPQSSSSAAKRKAVPLQEISNTLGAPLTPGDITLLLSLACARRPSVLLSIAPSELSTLPVHCLRSDSRTLTAPPTTNNNNNNTLPEKVVA